MTTRQKPVKVKKGSVEVRIYRREKEGRVYYQIADYSSGKRRFKNCSDLAEAKREAISIAEKLSRGEAAALELTNEDRSVYVRALSNLKPTGITLDVATHNYAEACKILGGDWIIEAAKFYKKRNLTKIPPKPIQEVVEEFIASKKSRQNESDTGRGLSERDWCETLISKRGVEMANSRPEGGSKRFDLQGL